MLWINKITNQAKQQMNLVGADSQQISFYLYFAASQNSWFFNISYGNLNANGVRLTIAPNLLRNYKNNIDFGMCCISTDGFDPNNIEDFISGRVQLYLLDAAEVAQLEADAFA